MKKRLLLIAVGIFGLFSLLVAQYFKIQVTEHEKWSKIADKQHRLVVKEPCKRGSFYTQSKGVWQPLAFDVTKYHLYIDPLSIPERCRDEVAGNVIELAHLPWDVFSEFGKRSRSRRLALSLDKSVRDKVLAWWAPYAKSNKIASNALFFMVDYQRCYPHGPLLGQVVHTIRELKDEKSGDALPTGGLESYFNDILKGKGGVRRLLRSPLNHLELDEVVEQPEDGAEIFLTLDHTIQAIVEQELSKGVAASHAKGGWAVMMEAKTGAIIACAQVPTFDPTNYRDYFNDVNRECETRVQAVSDAFEIGSIMKPITLGIGLRANEELIALGKPPIFNPHDAMDVTRSQFPGRRSKPLYDLPRHKAINMSMALQKSSNVYMAEIADRVVNQLGIAWYRKELVDTFGFECKTGIELPAEAIGLVPSSHRRHPNGAVEWSLSTPYSLSIGYNLLATSLQMLRAVAVFPSGGYLVKPTLVEKIVKQNEVIYQREVQKKRVLSQQSADQVVSAMKFATKPGGTGRLASISGYTEAGKTGSAEKIVGGIYSKKKHISSFIGFAPANFAPETNPLVLIVSIDEPEAIVLENGIKGYLGGRCAAPVFREAMRRSLEYLGVPYDDPFGYPVGDPRYHPDKADWMPEVVQVKQLYEQWNKR